MGDGAADHERRERDRGVVARAEDRDEKADARDVVADERDSAASLHSLLHEGDSAKALQARRAAAMDRSDSKSDRESAAKDRSQMSDHGGNDDHSGRR